MDLRSKRYASAADDGESFVMAVQVQTGVTLSISTNAFEDHELFVPI